MNKDTNKDYKFIAIGRIIEYVYSSSVGSYIIEFSSKDTECTVWFIYQ